MEFGRKHLELEPYLVAIEVEFSIVHSQAWLVSLFVTSAGGQDTGGRETGTGNITFRRMVSTWYSSRHNNVIVNAITGLMALYKTEISENWVGAINRIE